QSIARHFWPGEDAVGRTLGFDWGPGHDEVIVGIAGDVHQAGLDRAADDILYRPIAQFPQRWFNLVVRTTGDSPGLAHAVRGAIAAVDSSIAVFDAPPLSSLVADSMAPRRSLLLVLGAFSAIAVALAVVGAYAVTAQLVARRTREIGLRIACGARQ